MGFFQFAATRQTTKTDGRLCPGLAGKATTSVEDFQCGALTFKLFIALLVLCSAEEKAIRREFHLRCFSLSDFSTSLLIVSVLLLKEDVEKNMQCVQYFNRRFTVRAL